MGPGERIRKVLSKLFWKSEHVLDILMRQGTEAKVVDNENYQRLLTIWRNKFVSRMVSFVGHKFAGRHFLHSVALKPFYASSSKITVFYLSQFFQSLRWDTNF